MPTRRGKCVNFGLCNRADSREVMQVAEGADPICPECQKPLQLEKGGGGGSGRKIPGLLPLILISCVALGLVGFAWNYFGNRQNNNKDGAVPPSTGPKGTILRMHGSNTIGAQLAPALAEAFLRSRGATDVKSVPGAADEVTVSGILPGDSSASSIEIAAHGSDTAFADLRDNKCDVGNASRRIKQEEVASLAHLGNMTSRACEHVLGLDGVALIVNVDNPIQALTVEQIRKIFAGDITDWNQVRRPEAGGINVYARDQKSGTWDTFKNLVMHGRDLVTTVQRFEDSSKLSDRVAGDPDGIGFIGLPYVQNAKAIAVSEEGTHALMPNVVTVAREEYPLSRRLYLYTAANPQNPMVRDYVRFALSPAGQEIVAKKGFVELTAQRVPAPAPPRDAPQEYTTLTRGANPFRFNIYFETGVSDLDNKALDDIDRLVAEASSPPYSGEKLLLMGFADSRGSAATNLALSQGRAEAVAEEFRKRGLQVAVVTGFGAALPIRSNQTAEGQKWNRRVEIWAKD
jgi:phosphate transport system substrate-binding protein